MAHTEKEWSEWDSIETLPLTLSRASVRALFAKMLKAVTSGKV